MKTCVKCGVEKELVEYSKKGKYLGSYCKTCAKNKSFEWRLNNPEKAKKNRTSWRLNNPEKAKKSRMSWNLNNPERVKENRMSWDLNNPEKIKEYRKKSYYKMKKMSHTLTEISNIFTSKLWPYSTDGKNEVTKEMREIMGDIGPVQKNSFLSMPNLGRELNMLQDVIRFEDSVGIERDSKLFRSIQRAFAKFFPTMKVEKDCIDKYSINTDKVFDVAHLDYNGGLTAGHIEATKKLVNDGTMTFVTLNLSKRFEKMGYFKPVEDLASVGKVIFEKEYYGKKKCPMITLGLI